VKRAVIEVLGQEGIPEFSSPDEASSLSEGAGNSKREGRQRLDALGKVAEEKMTLCEISEQAQKDSEASVAAMKARAACLE